MADFPISLDSLPTDILGTDKQSARDHALLHNDAADAINELEIKVGITGSTVTDSHEYKIDALETNQASLLTDQHAHSNLSFLETLINTGIADKYLGEDGTYHYTHSHVNLPALNGIVNTGVGTNYLGDDGNYHATHTHSNMSVLNNLINGGPANEFLAADGNYYAIGGTGASGHDIQYDTVGLPVRSILNFYGAGIKVYDNAGTDSVDIFVEGVNSATGSAHIHHNPALNTNWYVNHELNTTDVIIMCYDINGHYMEFDSIDFVDSDNLTIHFSGPACGKVVILTKGTSGSGGCCDDGLSGDTHSQITPSDTWDVVHNLDTDDVIVMVYDTLGHYIEFDDIELISNTELTIRFSAPVAGKAVVLCEMTEDCQNCAIGQACEIQWNDVNILAGVETLNFTGVGINNVSALGTKVTVDVVGGGGSGEVNTTSNVGAGEILALPKVGVDLPFKSIVAGTNVTLVPTANELRIDVIGTTNGFYDHTQGAPASTWNVNHNLGSQTITFRAYDATGNWIEPDTVTIVDDNNMTVEFTSPVDGSLSVISGGGTGGSGEVNTASNLGVGEGVFSSKVGVDLQMKSLIAGTNVTLTSDANEITINSTATGGVALPILLGGTTHTAAANDAVIAGNATATTTITLPSAAANAGEKIMVKKNNASAFDTNIVPQVGDTVNGEPTGATIAIEHTSVILISDGVDTRHVF